MTEQTRATTQLLPEEWKTLCLLSINHLYGFLQGIPSATESGASNITDQHLAIVDAQIGRAASFLQAWRRARIPGSLADRPIAVPQELKAAEPEAHPDAVHSATNGSVAPKRRGGWPKGRSRKSNVATQ